MVDKWIPVAFGYCPQDPECASCAGTGYKPNIVVNVGRPTETLACPYCYPERYRKELGKLGKLPPPAPPTGEGEDEPA